MDWAGRGWNSSSGQDRGQDRGQMERRNRYSKHHSPSGQGAGYNSRTHNGPHYFTGRDGSSAVDIQQVHKHSRSQNLHHGHSPPNYYPQASGGRGRGGHSHYRFNDGGANHNHNHRNLRATPQSHNNYRKQATAPFNPFNTQRSGGENRNESNFNNNNYFQTGNRNQRYGQHSVPDGGFYEQRSSRGRAGYRGSGYNRVHNPFKHSSSSETAIDYDVYDADASSSLSENEPDDSEFLGRWVANPLTEVASELDSVLLHLLRNSPQLNTTLCRFMRDYNGPDDLEFWMNTLGTENMRWEVLHEVERSSLQMPPGWNCVMKELEERQLDPNRTLKPASPNLIYSHTELRH